MKKLGRVVGLLSVPILLVTAIMQISTAEAIAAGDPSAGEDVYASECSDCHSVRKGKNKKGPSLFGIVGRDSHSISNFHYSDAMSRYNVVWTPEKIESYITHPKQVVPGNKMKYDGLANAKARADLLAFLETKK